MDSLFTSEEQSQFQNLRERELSNQTLTISEQTELAEYIHRIEAEESRVLQPARVRAALQNAELDYKIVALRELLARQKSLSARFEQATDEVERQGIIAEHAHLRDDLERLRVENLQILVLAK